jgi:hypothetical protein
MRYAFLNMFRGLRSARQSFADMTPMFIRKRFSLLHHNLHYYYGLIVGKCQ